MAQPTFGAGSRPQAVTVGDFNEDGHPDFVVTNEGANGGGTVSVFLGTGTGSFGAQSAFTVGRRPVSVAVGDFNGDGHLDLAVANFVDGTVSVLLGTGTGSFGSQTAFTVGLRPISVAVGDFNGDGHLDLAVANLGATNADSTVSVLLGTGTGSFEFQSNFPVGNGPSSVAVGDFNGDGHLDLVVANSGETTTPWSGNTVSVLLGTGTGSFGAQTTFTVGQAPASVVVGDFNADGSTDLAVANFSDGTVSVLLGTGTGSFGAQTAFTVGGQPNSMAMGFFKGDGQLDLAVANGQISVLPSIGAGAFGIPTSIALKPAVTSVAVADFNGDGLPDLVVVNEQGDSVTVLLNDCK